MNPLTAFGVAAKETPDTAVAETKPANAGAGLPQPTQALNTGIQQVSATQPLPDTVAQHVKVGQTEVAAWYRDNNDQHLAMAKTHFEEAVRQAPSHPDAHHGLAIIADLQQQYQLAELHYQKALSANPNNAKVLGDMGYSYLLQGRYSESEGFLTRAIELDATNHNAIKHLGDVYARQGRETLARTTYAAVMNSQEVQAALSENLNAAPQSPASSTPQVAATEEKSSFLDRLLPQKKEELSPTDEIRKLMLEEREKRERERLANQQQTPASNPRPYPHAPQRPYYTEEEYLKAEMARMDRERYQGAANGPIVIDPQTGQTVSGQQGMQPGVMGQQPPQYQHQGVATNTPPPQNYGPSGYSPANGYPPQGQRAYDHGQAQYYQPNPQQFGPGSAIQQTHGQYQPAPAGPAYNGTNGQPTPSQNPNSPYFSQSDLSGASAANAMPQISPQQRTSPSTSDGPREEFRPQQNAFAQARAKNGRQPWNGIQQAAGEESHRHVDRAHHQQQENSAQPIQTLGGELQAPGPARTSSVPPQFGGELQQPPQPLQLPTENSTQMNQMQNQAQPQPANAFEEASKRAAEMGMGLGGGNVFPIFQQTTQRVSPGVDTRVNGTSFAQPQRYLPTDLPPQDLSQAYGPNGPEMAPPPNSLGQRMPSSMSPNFSQQQFGTASRYNPATMQPAAMPQFQQGHGYPNGTQQTFDSQRQQVDQQLNQNIQQAWGQQHPQSATISPAGGANQLDAPAVYGGMMTNFSGDPSQPPSWPHPQNAPHMNSGNSQPYSNSYQGGPGQTEYTPGVVVPPPYPGAPATLPQYQQGGQTNHPLPAPNRNLRTQQPSGGNGLPLIRPGSR